MNDQEINQKPEVLDAIRKDTEELGFTMASEPKTGALLAVLAASKPGGQFLELGTGTGLGTAWLLSGMDADARLDTVDIDADVVAVAKRHLGADSRVTFHASHLEGRDDASCGCQSGSSAAQVQRLPPGV